MSLIPSGPFPFRRPLLSLERVYLHSALGPSTLELAASLTQCTFIRTGFEVNISILIGSSEHITFIHVSQYSLYYLYQNKAVVIFTLKLSIEGRTKEPQNCAKSEETAY